jgi:NADH-quinone oxidoreductase subunit C
MPGDSLKYKLAGIALGSASPTVGGAGASTGPAPLISETSRAAKGYDLDVTVPAEHVVDAARLLDEAGYMLEAITGVDWMAEQQLEVVYDYTATATGERVAVRVRVPRTAPELPTISSVHPGANWHERETHDFFGVRFAGHPNMTPLLLPEDADFHPLRKDFGA